MKLVRWLIHFPCLVIVLVLVIHVLSSLTDDLFFTWFFRFIAIVICLGAQFLRGMARLHLKAKLPNYQWKVFGYWFLVIVYIICFEFLASVGSIVSQVGTVEQKQETESFIHREDVNDYGSLKSDLETYKRYREEENQTGKGGKFSYWDGKVSETQDKLEILKSKIESVPAIQKETKKSPFISLQQVYKLPADTFKGIMIAAALMIAFVILLVTPWELPIELLGNDSETIMRLPQNTYHETDIETVPKNNGNNNETDKKICPICLKEFSPTRSDQIYCGDNCKVRAFRNKKRLEA